MANKPNITDDDIKTEWGGGTGQSRLRTAGPDDQGRDDSDDQGKDDPASDDQGKDDAAGGDDQGRDDAGGDDKGRDDS